MLLFALAMAPGFPVLRAILRERMRGLRGGAISTALFLIPYLFYCAGTNDFRAAAFGKVAALAAVPFVLFTALPVRRPEALHWQDALALLWLELPVVFGKIGGIWNVPENLDFMARVFLLGVGAWSFLVLRSMEGSGYEFRIARASVRDMAIAFAGFGAVALPLGWAMRFITWNPQFHGLPDLLIDYVTIFLFIAILEELFFRGVLQNLLEGSLRSRYFAQALAAAIFGLSHIRHAPGPNWRYVALASVAGWFYGSAYRNRRNVMASAIVHAAVDTVWRTWFTAPRI
jgi:membrane protease YdiL (CAAX protease family)